MKRDNRSRRDVHALDDDGNVLCNPRDKEAAHRAEVGDIAVGEGAEVTCSKCRSLQYKVVEQAKLAGDSPEPAGDPLVDPVEADDPTAVPFVRMGAMASVAAEFRSGDGVDPKEERRRRDGRERRGKPNYANERLASQIYDALCLSSVLVDIGLEDFAFVSVRPEARPGRFVVEVACHDPHHADDPEAVQQRLQTVRGGLRADVAAFIHRKKVPELLFEIRPWNGA